MGDPDALLDVTTAVDRLAADLARVHLFAGLAIEEATESLALSRSTAYHQSSCARAWLAVELASLDNPPR